MKSGLKKKGKPKTFKFNISNVENSVNGIPHLSNDHYYNPLSKPKKQTILSKS